MVMPADIPKVRVFDVEVSVTDYAEATAAIVQAGKAGESVGVTALATHGLMEAAADAGFAACVNSLDLVAPDGQPVRWAMNLLAGTRLRERVYGPDLMAHVCAAAAASGTGVFLYGSTEQTCVRLTARLRRRWPALDVRGVQADRFREASPAEDAADVEHLNASGAGIVFVGRGCPRQERWVAGHRGQVHAAMVAVGAAFDYHAGNLRRPPALLQRLGLEWAYRLVQEPRRLFRRYAVSNSRYLVRLARELFAARQRGRR